MRALTSQNGQFLRLQQLLLQNVQAIAVIAALVYYKTFHVLFEYIKKDKLLAVHYFLFDQKPHAFRITI